MNERRHSDITITEMCPLIIEERDYIKAYGIVTLEKGGYIEIRTDCQFSIDELVKEFEGISESPDIILKGIDGDVGKPGEDGNEGKPGAQGEITIENLRSNLNVHVYGGGEGGHGGYGGAGGQGGNGVHGGSGGNGGDGGDGTTGGKGGSGGVLKIIYKSENGCEITGQELCASGGEPGIPGEGGEGGDGFVKGQRGRDGRSGRYGEAGGRGRLIINGRGDKK